MALTEEQKQYTIPIVKEGSKYYFLLLTVPKIGVLNPILSQPIMISKSTSR